MYSAGCTFSAALHSISNSFVKNEEHKKKLYLKDADIDTLQPQLHRMFGQMLAARGEFVESSEVGFFCLRIRDDDAPHGYHDLVWRKPSITLGRASSKESSTNDFYGVGADKNNKNVSRQHMSIKFDNKTGSFMANILGKNGCDIDGTPYKKGDVVQFASDTVTAVRMGSCCFYFLPPSPR